MCYWIRSVRHVSATLLSTKRRRLFQAHCQLQHAPIRPGSRCTHGTVTQLVAPNIEGEQPAEQARGPSHGAAVDERGKLTKGRRRRS
jgi:hypothetical protein